MAPPRTCAIRALAFTAPLFLLAQALTVADRSTNDRTITQVVKLLQGMVEQSQTEGKSERDLYAKFKCFCDTNEADKKKEIADLTEEIGVLENSIEELLAASGIASSALSKVKRDIEDTKQERLAATTQRGTENGDFLALETDLYAAMNQTHDAIEVLSAIGADQSMSVGADHEEMMAGYNETANYGHVLDLAALGQVVRKAVVAADSLASASQSKTLESFLQAPVGGAYSAQSGEVVGILKQMRNTFKANVAEAIAREMKAQAAYDEYMGITQDRLDKLGDDETDLQTKLSDNDGTLATKRGQLTNAKDSKAAAELYLSQLLAEYERKTKQYGQRVELRTKEEAALAEAISILNSDAAFATFGTTDATKTGAIQFVQLQSVHRHSTADEEIRQKAQAFLRKAANTQHAPLLGKIAALLQANNPFDTVLKEIKKLIDLIAAEEQADDDQKAWCDSERTETDQAITNADGEITRLTTAIDGLVTTISDPQTGLEKQIADEETTLQTLRDNAKTQTETRTKENLAYQKDIANLQDAQALLARAIVVLRKYYSTIDQTIAPPSFGQVAPPPAFPTTWNDKFTGQSGAGKGVIGNIEFILTNTKAEETAAHDAELTAQHQYEDDMTTFTTNEAASVATLAQLRESLAIKKKELHDKRKERAASEKEKAALEAYLEKIKPGCDFITTNIATRKANRATEKTALEQARDFLKASPAYLSAEAKAADEALGDCLGTCRQNGETHVECKACLNKVTVPGYCAGHPTTAGC